jgi:hypothetical protein
MDGERHYRIGYHGGAMRGLRLLPGILPALVVYICLDVANPLMPGAVHFVDGGMRVVQADRSRADLADTGAVDPTPIVVAPLPAMPRAPRPRAARRPRPVHRWRPRRMPPPAFSPPATPAEDH